ncbi:competence/damage-inducible protein A [Paenactinomyces guangxiensis]|uniref:Putative competence-damage inducible protein n=1 Tax=Paenactinomyces guangxiensis TaxID=1490290 RepID=A0A7W1WR87_9BACL|nr:competence/damage-inducible protein A [Paenactinomyces guangxiensis]MBA4494411.1 competence/damage-inducible protein A [Paenactinomyces guangxiensis]MBH8591534.1 competence/damage-inducible protein A [Paenactinomyces guangxiensis]
MRAEIITVGTELLLGQTLDRHSAYLSQECSSLGIDVYFHTSVGDDARRLLEVIRIASSRSDLVLLCGGLGPTMDDLTKETLARFLKVNLIQDSASLAHLQKIFAGRSLPIPENNYKQTYVFPGGTVFPNENGTAPGLAITSAGITYVLMPGPPKELVPMFEHHVRPFLIGLLPEKQVIVSHPLSFFGIGESLLEKRLSDIIEQQTNPVIATYAKEAGVTLRLTAKARDDQAAHDLIAPVRAQILDRVGEYCFSEEDSSLEEVVVSLLRQQKRSIALAESCTGGLAAHLLSTVPGSSHTLKGGFVSYTDEVKNEIVHVPKQVLIEEGAISSAAAEAMAQQTRQQFQSDFALSITGVAGPDPAEGKPVGQVFVGLAEVHQPTRVYQYLLKGSRQRIQLLAAKHALFILQQRLKKGETTT